MTRCTPDEPSAESQAVMSPTGVRENGV